MAGYSGTPLAKKLGIRDDARVALVGAPAGFEATLSPLPAGATVKKTARGPLDLILFFSKTEGALEKRLARLAKALVPSGGLWVAWPKKASGVATDLDFSVVQRAGLELGLVDNKICAVDDTWSGLRFVVRLKDRPSKRKRR